MSELTIKTKILTPCTLITANGRIDSSNAGELDNALKEHNKIALNLAGVTYMSSAGLRALVSAKKRGDIRIVSPSSRVTEVLELAGLNTMFKLFDTNEDAVGSHWTII